MGNDTSGALKEGWNMTGLARPEHRCESYLSKNAAQFPYPGLALKKVGTHAS